MLHNRFCGLLLQSWAARHGDSLKQNNPQYVRCLQNKATAHANANAAALDPWVGLQSCARVAVLTFRLCLHMPAAGLASC